MIASVATNRDRVAPLARKLMKSAAVVLALLFVMLRPVCEAFAASDDWHAPAAFEHGTARMAGTSAGGHVDEGICCARAHAQALTVRATAPLPATSPSMLPVASTEGSLRSIPLALPMNALARRDPAPPLPYHARSLRRLD